MGSLHVWSVADDAFVEDAVLAQPRAGLIVKAVFRGSIEDLEDSGPEISLDGRTLLDHAWRFEVVMGAGKRSNLGRRG